MNITYGQGSFFMATMEEIVEACQETMESLEALIDRLMGFGTPCQEIAALAADGYCPTPREIERAGWRSAAAHAIKKAAARAQAFSRQMMQQKARQAMKRRKLKHADGSFPDWGCACVR